MPEEIPNSQQPAQGGDGQGQEQKPVMGTTPTSQQAPKPAPTSPEAPKGTEGEQKPNTPPNDNQGEGGEQKVDYEKKFSESSKEAQRLLSLLKNAGIDPETGKPIEAPKEGEQPADGEQPEEPGEPVRAEQQYQPTVFTDEQLKKAIPGFANLPEEQKVLMRDIKSVVSVVSKMQHILNEIVDEREYSKAFKKLTSNEEWKQISEFADEFREFAYTKDNLKTPLETLASSFLYNKGKGGKKPDEKPPAPSGVESGGAGKGEEKGTRQEGYTAEEAEKIRRSDPRRYAQLVRSGKFKIREE